MFSETNRHAWFGSAPSESICPACLFDQFVHEFRRPSLAQERRADVKKLISGKYIRLWLFVLALGRCVLA
jgi:hypothetical protein